MPEHQTTTRKPLRLSRNEWRRRWLVTRGWRSLHRIAEIEWNNDERLSGRGSAVCGMSGEWQMPGIFSRMGLPRCKKCCKALGLPYGDGAPFNALEGKLQNV